MKIHGRIEIKKQKIIFDNYIIFYMEKKIETIFKISLKNPNFFQKY